MKPKLVIAETSYSNWNYHLRLVLPGEEKYSGGAGPALCGQAMGWDTKIPLSVYGNKDHIPSSYCSKCKELAEAQGFVISVKVL